MVRNFVWASMWFPRDWHGFRSLPVSVTCPSRPHTNVKFHGKDCFVTHSARNAFELSCACSMFRWDALIKDCNTAAAQA